MFTPKMRYLSVSMSITVDILWSARTTFPFIIFGVLIPATVTAKDTARVFSDITLIRAKRSLYTGTLR